VVRTPLETTAAALAQRLRHDVARHLDAFVDRYAPGFVLPSTFAGWPVGSDVHADLAFTLAWLRDGAVGEVAGVPVDDAIGRLLRRVDGAGTHTFFSYRVAETLARFGPWADNDLIRGWDDQSLAELAAACDTTSWLPLLDQGLPANYAAVLARCELARSALGFPIDEAVVEDLLTRTRRLLTANRGGYLDDSGAERQGRYDVYTADVYLFTHPFADRIGPAWEPGARAAVDLTARVGTTNGAAVPWGRSLGVLAVCHTIELGALALSRALGDPGLWRARTAAAVDRVGDWFDHGLATAHVHRSQDHYRGPERWLQLTFDCLGKLAWAAAMLDTVGDPSPGAADPFPDRDELVWFDAGTRAAVWTHRSAGTALVLPLVGTPWADYLPAPRNPGLYEVPVDVDLPTGVPVVTHEGVRYVGGGLPASVEHRPGSLTVVWDGLPELATRHHQGRRLGGRRVATYHVEGATLHVDEQLALDVTPDAVSVQLAEAADRPLRLDWRAAEAPPAKGIVVPTDGLAAYRSFWGPLTRVHQLDLPARAELAFGWSATPRLRIATVDPGHHYHRSLYDPLRGRVVERGFGGHLLARPDEARARLRAVDAFHLHWPEWFVSTVEQTETFLDLLDDTGTALIWTQHNLVPHTAVADADAIYARFAARADVVVHHTEWGRHRVTARYPFDPAAAHVVLPHGHFGHLVRPADRRDAEAELGLAPTGIRIGIVGAPRRDKRTGAFVEAFARTTRPDLQLLVLSLGPEELAADRVDDVGDPLGDPRILALPYEFVPREVYDRRMATLDAVALPFADDGDMLTTGTVGDVVAFGLPALTTGWPFLAEALGEAAIPLGDDWTATIEGLTTGRLAEAAAAARSLQDRYDWAAIAERFLDTVIEAGALKR
jgi:glycosyltransferase involved in cell wall biosynthesis